MVFLCRFHWMDGKNDGNLKKNFSFLFIIQASTIFASPPTSSYEEALKYFEEAQKIEPQFIRNAISIGDCYANLKKQDEAQKWYKTAAAIPPRTDAEKVFIEEAKKKMK